MTRYVLSLLVALAWLAPGAGPAHAQSNQVTGMGQVIGAASECKMNSNRVVMLTRRAVTATERMRGSTRELQAAINAGSDQVRRGRLPCANARTAFEQLEEALAELPPKPL